MRSTCVSMNVLDVLCVVHLYISVSCLHCACVGDADALGEGTVVGLGVGSAIVFAALTNRYVTNHF